MYKKNEVCDFYLFTTSLLILFRVSLYKIRLMKHQGCISEHNVERNRDLVRAYIEAIGNTRRVYMPQLLERIVNMPSKRFWITAERAAIMVARIMKGDKLTNMRPVRREMFFEIYRRVVELQKMQPNEHLINLAQQAIESPAPKFYLTSGTARLILYRTKKIWFKERHRKTQH